MGLIININLNTGKDCMINDQMLPLFEKQLLLLLKTADSATDQPPARLVGAASA